MSIVVAYAHGPANAAKKAPAPKTLHLLARELALPDPETGTTLRVTAPLPPHMAATWQGLGFDEAMQARRVPSGGFAKDSVDIEGYVELFGDHRPARSAIGVAELPVNALVEIEAWAWLGGAGGDRAD